MRLRSTRAVVYAIVLVAFSLLVFQNRFDNNNTFARDLPPWIESKDAWKYIATTKLPLMEKASSQKRLVIPSRPIRKIRLLCFVKTQLRSFSTKAQAIKNTWGKRCDKLIFISNQANITLPAIGIQPNVSEARTTLSQKVFGAMKVIYQFYIDDFDWIQEADDDTYIVVDNLRYFLADKDPKQPVYYGHRFKKFTVQGYTSGGAGYVMSNEALRRFGLNWQNHKQCKLKGAGSDANMGHCLNALGVRLEDSTDSMGRSRFHVFDIETHLLGLFPNWFYNYTGTDRSLLKANYMSDYPISFHYSANRKMYLLEYLFYRARVWGQFDRVAPVDEMDKDQVDMVKRLKDNGHG